MKNTIKIFLTLLFLVTTFLVVEQQVSADTVNVTTPETPELYAPFNKTTSEDSTPKFSWEDVGAERYRWEILDNDTGVTIKKAYYTASVRCDGTTCEIPSPTTLDNGDYKWHVVALNGTEWGLWSTYNVLYVGTEVFPRPALRSPGADAIVYGGRPTFKWYPVEGDGISRAAIEVTDVNGDLVGLWNAAVDNDNCPTYCQYRIPLNLGNVNNGNDGYGDYNWRVQVMNDDKSEVSRYSVQRTFSYTQLDRVSLVSPANPTTTADTTPVMTWTTVPGATYYILNVRTLNDVILTWDLVPASVCDDVSGTCSAVPSEILQDGNYKWHVRSKNGINYGRWTGYWNITTTTIIGTEYPFDFEGTLDPESPLDFDPYWIDADAPGNWIKLNGRYRGSEGTEEGSYNSIAYFDHSFGDAIFESNMRSGGDDADLGFTLIFHGSFDGSNNLDDGYVVKVSEGPEGILARFWRVEDGGEVEPMGEVNYSGDGGEYPSPSGFHLYRIELFGNTMTFSIDGTELHTLAGLDVTLSDGRFGIDLESSIDHNLYVDIEEVTMTDMDTP